MISPPAVIGIVGGGQLAKMSAVAAAALGYKVHVFTNTDDSPAVDVCAHAVVADYYDKKALLEFAAHVDVVTFEFENIPYETLVALAKKVEVNPDPQILYISQNRVREKSFVRGVGVGTARFAAIRDFEDLQERFNAFGASILKTQEMGYDGKGQYIIRSEEQVKDAWKSLAKHKKLILESLVNFEKEISVIVARNKSGEICAYHPVENVHAGGILDITTGPAQVNKDIAEKARAMATRIAEELKLIGILALEMFLTKEGELLVNEMAPRPHNSGHCTIEACYTSQFEQFIRAVCGLPFGSPDFHSNAKMKNLIGEDIHLWKQYANDPYSKVHIYGKKEVRAGRKMGHVTTLSPLEK